MSLHVAMLISRYPPSPGGAEQQARSLSVSLARAGVRVTVLTQRLSRAQPRFERVDGVDVRRMGFPGTSRAASFLFLADAFLWLLRTRPAPDVFHAHMISSPALLACFAGGFFRRTCVVKVACAGPYGDVLTSERSLLGRLKLRWVLKKADRLVCLSPAIEGEVRGRGAPAGAVVLIPNGVDADRFRPPRDGAEKESLREELGLSRGRWILFAGRMTSQKRPDLVLEAFARVHEEFPDARLLLAGDGPLRPALEEKIDESGLKGRVLCRPHSSRIDAYYRACDIFALASEGEGLSNSLLEAMSTGLICAASRIPGNEDLIVEGKNGFLFPSGDADGLAGILRGLLKEGGALSSVGAAARRSILEGYRLEGIAERYAALYRELAA